MLFKNTILKLASCGGLKEKKKKAGGVHSLTPHNLHSIPPWSRMSRQLCWPQRVIVGNSAATQAGCRPDLLPGLVGLSALQPSDTQVPSDTQAALRHHLKGILK